MSVLRNCIQCSWTCSTQTKGNPSNFFVKLSLYYSSLSKRILPQHCRHFLGASRGPLRKISLSQSFPQDSAGIERSISLESALPMSSKVIKLQTKTASSSIFVGECQALIEEALTSASLIVIDREILALVSKKFVLTGLPVVEIAGGEECKSLAKAELLYDECFRRSLDKGSSIVGIGGGTICDLVAFVAATYLRGTKLTLIPTTLLSQVDASVGGKNGVNFNGVKNLIGTTRQPESCICDAWFLESLPENLVSEGYAEIIKHGLIASAELFLQLEKKVSLADILYDAILIKRDIVQRDEDEKGERRKLNFGHTIGHAIEAKYRLSHGAAVALGMMSELQISKNRGFISDADCKRVEGLISAYALPTKLEVEKASLIELIRRDKKRFGDTYSLPLILEIGRSEIFEVHENELLQCLDV